METFKERLEKLMEAKGFNAYQLATELGTSPINIYGYLNGRAEQPSLKMLRKFEKIGVRKEWLTDGIGEMFVQEGENIEEVKEEKIHPTNYLMEAIARIEASFKSTSEEKDRVIADQRFIIDTLKSQVAALSSVNGDFIDVSEVPPVPFVKKRMQVIFKVENPVFLSNG